MAIEDWLHPLLSRYVASPQWVKSSVGRIYALVPKRIRYGAHFARFRDDVIRCNDGESLDAAVQAKLAATLHEALTHVPAFAAYRHLLELRLAPLELLARLPLTSKADIKADLGGYLSTRFGASDRLEMFTGGSTSTPMRFYLHKHVTRPKENAYFEDFDRRAGWSPGDVILNLRGRNVPGAGEPGKRMWMFEPVKRQLILSSDHLEARFMPEYIEAVRKWKPSFIHCFASTLYPLARWLQAHPAPDVTERIRGIELTSENTYDYQLEVFRSVFRCPVIRGYGHTERAVLAATMPDDDRYFFWPLYGHVELVDANGAPITEPGVLGQIVGTSFDNDVMPFIRYRTGDLGAWGALQHPKLPGFPVLERIEGRLQEFVVCSDMRLISVNSLSAAHYAELAEIQGIQYEQSVAGMVTLKVVAAHTVGSVQANSISRAMQRKAQDGCAFHVVQVPAIERTLRGKQRMLVQHLDLSAYFAASYNESRDE